MELSAWLYPACVVLAGYVVLGITGFGSALIIVPLLACRWPLVEVVPLILLLDVPASALHGRLNWQLVQWRELLRLLPAMLLGAALGLLLVAHLHARWPLLVLGLYVMAVGLRALRQKPEQIFRQAHPRGVWLAGSAIGVVEMLFGTSGPLLVAWLTRRVPDAQQLRASTPVAIVAVATLVLLGMATQGRLSVPLLWLRVAVFLPLAFAGVWLGHKMASRLQPERLRRVICVLLVCSGMALAAKALG